MKLSTLLEELSSLSESISGLRIAVLDADKFGESEDAGKFRDFADAGTVDHDDPKVLAWIAEELVDEFGWRVDLVMTD